MGNRDPCPQDECQRMRLRSTEKMDYRLSGDRVPLHKELKHLDLFGLVSLLRKWCRGGAASHRLQVLTAQSGQIFSLTFE
jgi:hypothetical protein